MREHGLPDRIRTDNGSPFATTGLLGLSKLSIKWRKLGILHERIHPREPGENGRHARMHRTLKLETATPPAFTLRELNFGGVSTRKNRTKHCLLQRLIRFTSPVLVHI